MGNRARILHLYTLYTALDIPLVSRTLGIRPDLAAAHLKGLVRRGQAVRLPRRCQRRPYVRTEYVLRSC